MILTLKPACLQIHPYFHENISKVKILQSEKEYCKVKKESNLHIANSTNTIHINYQKEVKKYAK
jgi:hypothetical protein